MLFHFSFSDQLEKNLVPRRRCCLYKNISFQNFFLVFYESVHISVVEPCGPSNRAGSTWRGASRSSRERDWHFSASSSIPRLTSPQSTRPRLTSPQSTRPLIQGDASYKLPLHGRISASIWSETELNVNTPN